MGVSSLRRAQDGDDISQQPQSLFGTALRAAAHRIFRERVLAQDKIGGHVRQHVGHQRGTRASLVVYETVGLQELVGMLVAVSLAKAWSGRVRVDMAFGSLKVSHETQTSTRRARGQEALFRLRFIPRVQLKSIARHTVRYIALGTQDT